MEIILESDIDTYSEKESEILQDAAGPPAIQQQEEEEGQHQQGG
jgi:hypothetical protein